MTTGPNWARRYDPRTRRLCARPGCGAPAAATLRFQPTRREAWLVDLDENAARTEGDLCARHAVGLVLPRGWELHNDLSVDLRGAREPGAPDADRDAPRPRKSVARARRTGTRTTKREPEPMLPGLADAAPEPEPARVNGATADDAPRAEPEPPDAPATAQDAPAPAAEPDPAPSRKPAAKRVPAPPSADPDDDLGPQTPLLRRAFGNVWLPDRDG